MPSLTDKLKSLGVQKGPDKLKAPRSSRFKSVQSHLQGQVQSTERGEVYVVTSSHAIDGQDYPSPLWSETPLTTLAAWAGEPRVADMKREAFAFLDTETTGLSGGAGTFAFMVGIGKFEGEFFQLAQFFLREPGEEAAQLAAIEHFLAGCEAIVTFNGKSFDVPVLNTRFAQHLQPSPLGELAHLDLLHIARKLWKARLPSRRLGDLEVQILNVQRGEEEVPGYLVPQMYLDYLRSGDAEPLNGVFYHNRMDVVTMAALLTHIAQLLADPLAAAAHDLDIFSIGKLHEDLGHIAEARSLYLECLGRPLDEDVWLETARRLSFVFKRAEEWDPAMRLWETAAKKGQIYAHEELAKYFEHRARDLPTAEKWTRAALDTIQASEYPTLQRYQWQPALEKRLARIVKKMGGET